MKDKIRGLSLSNFKMYYIATVIKTVQFWQRNRQIDQWSRIEKPEADSQICSTDF